LITEPVSTGTDNLFNATFAISLDVSGLVTFSVTNVAIVTNGQPDTTDRLVFDSGSLNVTALFPDVSTVSLSATNIQPNSAYLSSSIICQDNFQAYFQYSTDTSLSSTSSIINLSGSSIAQTVSIPVTGLLAHQFYRFRAVGQDITGPSYGSVQGFITGDNPPVAGAVTAFAGTVPFSIPVLTHCSDPDGDKLKVTLVANGKHGRAAIVRGGAAVSYQFTSGTAPSDQFPYTINDGFGKTAIGQVTVTNYATLAGSYSALLVNPASNNVVSGYLRIQLLPTGACTGQVSFGGGAYRFSGIFDYNGHLALSLNPTQTYFADITLDMLQRGSGYALSATVISAGLHQVASLPRQAPGRGGTYTVLLPAPTGAGYLGTGYAIVQVAASGPATVTGALPDGAPFSCATIVSSSGTLDIYSPLYSAGNLGSLTGSLTISGSAPALVGGTLAWTKPALASAPISQGPFTLAIAVRGASYLPPVGQPALQFGTYSNVGHITLTGGNLNPPIHHGLRLDSNNIVTVLGPPNNFIALTVHPGSGLFSGQFIDPVANTPRAFHGVLLQSGTSGAGYFLGLSASGEIDISR
jgi:hypothetical protein